MTYFKYAMQTDEGGGSFDEDPISFGEAFGINPDGSPYEAPEADEEGGAAVPAEPEPTPPAPVPAEAEPAVGETPAQTAERLLAGKYKTPDDLEKGYKELEREYTRLKTTPPAPTEPEAPAVPLFKGEVGEIKTEKDLYDLATADPERAAHFAMQNNERLSPEQFNAVMDHWLATQPWKAMTQITAWQTEMMRDEFNERQALQDAAYINQVHDNGIEQAIKDQPMLQEYSQELGDYIEERPQLAAMVDGARTPGEVANALNAIFYMMVGPKLASQALEHQAASLAQQQQLEQQKVEQEKNAKKAGSLTRNTAPPDEADADYDKAMQDAILNPGGRR